ncbi:MULTISPECIES: hypothetical protein [Pseudoalteromonas]|uniref:Uncharacterized protein n=1 Tax=Pseudoalteromonas porphyrae TaxID=187330 RepID=A0A0N0M002_9GAMM|nr:hypothetical protein [Pseudoalteromonas porphyrae]KPH63491.1 hypothetical protein ADS77_09450 [Pseudoalteromonas porphyrae]
MNIQISKISSHQTSKAIALTFFVLTLPFGFIGLALSFFGPDFESHNGQGFPYLLFVFAPVIYGVMFYFMQRFFCFAYNLVAKRFGGIEFETKE